MWRSTVIARAAASISRQPRLFSLQNPSSHQVLYHHNNPSSHFLSNNTSISQIPRFFSTSYDSSIDNLVEQSQSQSQSSISEKTNNETHHGNGSSSSSSSESEEEHVSFSPISDEIGHAQIVVNDGDQSFEQKAEAFFEIDPVQLEGVLSLLQSSTTSIVDDGSLESALDNMGLTTFHQEFLVRVLETPLVPGENLIRFFKWYSSKPEISAVTSRAVTSRAMDALVVAICSGLRQKEAYALWDLVKEVGEKENNSILNTDILNELISLFSRLGKGKAGFEVFNKFEEFGCVPDAKTYYYTIEALCRRSIYDWACSVCEKMIDTGKLPDSEKIGAIISYLCKGSKAKDAHLVYLTAKEKDKYPPRSSVNCLISSLCRKDDTVGVALEMLDDFSADDRKRAINPFSSVIRDLCRIKDVQGAKKLLLNMIDAGPPPGNAVFNSIINGFSKAGDMEEAMKVLRMMENRGLKPDVYTYSVIMSGYTKGGDMEAACEVFAEAKKNHSKLSPVTYHTLIRGYCKLEEFDKALKLLSEMKEFGVRPTADEYNKLIQSICLKALDWEMAEKLLEEMKENGLNLNGITKGLIRAVKEIEEEEGKSGEVRVEAELLESAN